MPYFFYDDKGIQRFLLQYYIRNSIDVILKFNLIFEIHVFLIIFMM